MIQKSLAKNTLYNIIYQVLNLIFPLLTSVYVSRIILEDGIGRVAYAQNIASYFVSIAALGFPAYGIREIAKVAKSTDEKNKAFSEMFLINLISTAATVFVYLLLISQVQSFKENIQLYLAVGISVFLNFANIDWLYQGEEEYGYITLRSLLIKGISFIALLILVRTKNDYVKYAYISSIGTACNYLCNLIHARKFVSFTVKGLNLRRHLKPLAVLTVSSILGNIYNKIDVTMLGTMCTESVVGYYSNAHKIILILITCCISISAAFMPRFSFYYQNDKQAFDNLVEKGVNVLLMITIPACVGLLFLSKPVILLLFGINFYPSGITLAIFAPMIIIRSIGDLLCYQLLISIGQEKKRLFASFAAALVNVGLNALLIPSMAQNGAAVASVISELVVNGYLLIFVAKNVKIRLNIVTLIKTIVATVFMSIIVYICCHCIDTLVLSIFSSVVLGSLSFFGVGIALKNESVVFVVDKVTEMIRRGRNRT